jgi:hypothetical protein
MRKYSVHGKRYDPIYAVWASMIGRCSNPQNTAYDNYGGRGISVCEKWQDFIGFYEDMGDAPEGLTLDRINNELGYSPENCRWASRVEQSRNRRNVRQITIDGESAPLAEWASRYGINLATAWLRIKKGWSDEAAIKTPIIRDRKGKPRGYRWAATEELVIEHFDGPQEVAA